jgi:hypothetical protein
MALVACETPTTEASFTVDQRIDGIEDPDDGTPDRVQSTDPQMCVNSRGEVFVMWQDDRLNQERPVLWMNRSLSKGDPDTWLPTASRINQGDGNLFNPQLACNDEGVYVVWEDDRDGELQNHNIYFQRSVDGETWLPEDVRVEDDPNGLSYSVKPQITFDTNGELFVVWANNESGSYDIRLASSGDLGDSWRDLGRVDEDGVGDAWSGNPSIAVSNDGQFVWVAWEDTRDGKSDIYFNYSQKAGGGWEGEERIDLGDPEGEYESFSPQVCADGQSNVYVVWHDARGGDGYDVYYQYSANLGGTFLPTAQRLETDTPGFANSLFPRCVANGATLHTTWYDNRYEGYDVFYRRLTQGSPDGVEVRVDTGTPDGFANSLDAQIARYDQTVAIAWADDRAEAEANADTTGTGPGPAGYEDLYYNYSEGPSFDAETDYRIDSLLPGQSYKLGLQIALLGNELYAAWEDGRGGSSDIYFQRHLLGEQGTPPPVEDGAGAEGAQ